MLVVCASGCGDRAGDGVGRASSSGYGGEPSSTDEATGVAAKGVEFRDDAGAVERRFGNVQTTDMGATRTSIDYHQDESRSPIRTATVEHLDRSGSVVRRQVERMRADRVVVKGRPGIADAAMDAQVRRHGALGARRLGRSDFFAVSIPVDPQRYEPILARLSGDREHVAYAEPDYCIELLATPDDPSFGELWGLHNTGQTDGTADADIDAPEAWDVTTGSHAVLVGIIDSGIDYDHPDLVDNIWINPGESGTDSSGADKRSNGIDDDGNGYVDDWRGWDFADDDNDATDHNTHGTHVAGTIGATGDNGTGVVGVCWDVSLVPLKIFGSGGTTSVAIEALAYAAAMDVDLTNSSWGVFGYSQGLEDAIEAAGAAGGLFVAAAGNDDKDTDANPQYPACYDLDCIIAVAATDHNDERSDFSSYGVTTVDLAAPGSGILSTIPDDDYKSHNGTSMASPHVCGALALARSVAGELTAADLKNALLRSVDTLDSLDGLVATGGRLNVANLVQAVRNPYLHVDAFAWRDDGAGVVGDGDGVAEPGERWLMEVTVRNAGGPSIGGRVQLAAATAALSPLDAELTLADLAPTQTTTVSTLVDISATLATPSRPVLVATFHADGMTARSEDLALAVHRQVAISGSVRTLTGSQPVTDATVSFDGPQVTSVAVDGDGRYAATILDGAYLVAAAAPGYLEASREVEVPVGEEVDFFLGAPALTVGPDALTLTLSPGETAERTLRIDNSGDLDLVCAAEVGSRLQGKGHDTEAFYAWTDSDAPDGPAETWHDISGTGTRLSIGDDDIAYHEVDLGFAFPYYDDVWQSVFVSANGYLSFGSGSAYILRDEPLPYIFAGNGMIAPFWTVLEPADGGDIYFEDFGDHAIVQWQDVRYFIHSGTATFQVVLYATGDIEYRYGAISGPTDDCTVGWQRDRDLGATIAFDEDYVREDLTLVISRPWLSTTREEQTVAPGADTSLTLAVSAAWLEPGTYTDTIELAHNDPKRDDPLVVPVTLHVVEGLRDLRIDVAPAAGVSAAVDGGASQPVPADFDHLDSASDHTVAFDVIAGDG